jgi:hypothetical protein
MSQRSVSSSRKTKAPKQSKEMAPPQEKKVPVTHKVSFKQEYLTLGGVVAVFVGYISY